VSRFIGNWQVLIVTLVNVEEAWLFVSLSGSAVRPVGTFRKLVDRLGLTVLLQQLG